MIRSRSGDIRVLLSIPADAWFLPPSRALADKIVCNRYCTRWNGTLRDHRVGLEQQRAFDEQRGLVVEDVVSPLCRHELRGNTTVT